jgi:hypothetical protein
MKKILFMVTFMVSVFFAGLAFGGQSSGICKRIGAQKCIPNTYLPKDASGHYQCQLWECQNPGIWINLCKPCKCKHKKVSCEEPEGFSDLIVPVVWNVTQVPKYALRSIEPETPSQDTSAPPSESWALGR